MHWPGALFRDGGEYRVLSVSSEVGRKDSYTRASAYKLHRLHSAMCKVCQVLYLYLSAWPVKSANAGCIGAGHQTEKP